MAHGGIKVVVGLALAWAAAGAWASVPPEVAELVSEMQATGSSVRGGRSQALGLYFVGIGRTKYRPGAVSRSRELARMNAVKELSSALSMSVKARDVSALQMTQVGDEEETQSFFSSLTETSIDQLLKGVQVVSSGKNGQGEMEVVVYTTAQLQDMSSAFAKAQLQWGDRGVVQSVGIGDVRAQAEKEALRSAVEQVAGTLVVGKVSVNEREEMHKRLATTATALVEEYRVVKETKVEAEYRLEILARVNKRKLYENYRSYFKCLDNPVFCIVASDRVLFDFFERFFLDKGFSLVNDLEQCQYVIRLDGRFHDRPTPGRAGSEGTMLDLRIDIMSADGRRTLLNMRDRQSKDSEVLSAEQRHEEVARRIFNKLEPRLHKAIQDMVVRMLDEKDVTPAPALETGTLEVETNVVR